MADERARVRLQLSEISIASGDAATASKRLGEALDAWANLPMDAELKFRIATNTLLLALLRQSNADPDAEQSFVAARKALGDVPQADVDALATAWGKAHGLKYAAENRDWAMKQQVRLFDEADALLLVRFDRAATAGDETFAILKPIRWLKGGAATAELRIGSTMPPPCGQMIGHDAYYGKPGDVFLVYLSGGAQPSVMEAYSLDRIIEPRTIGALTKGPE